MNLYHKIVFWVFQVPEIENDEMAEEDVIGSSHILITARLSQADRETGNGRNFQKSRFLRLLPLRSSVQATGVGKQAYKRL